MERDILQAIIDGDIERVNSLIEDGIDINMLSKDGSPLLHEAIRHKNFPAFRVLLDSGADPNIRDSKGVAALIAVIEYKGGTLKFINALLEKGADPNVKNRENISALVSAVLYRKSSPKYLLALIEYGVDPNAIDPSFNLTPLQVAIKERAVKLIEPLLDAGANPNLAGSGFDRYRGVDYSYLADDASPADFIQEVYDLLNVSDRVFNPDCGHLPLIEAISVYLENYIYPKNAKHNDIFESLLASGADPHLPDITSDETPLHCACRRGYFGFVVTMLLYYNIDINRRNRAGETPLTIVVDQKQPFLLFVELLLIFSADEMAKDGRGKSAMDIAKGAGNQELIKMLSDASLLRSRCYSPLYIALSLGIDHIVEKLIKSGANLNEIDATTGELPLYTAIKRAPRCLDTVNLLIRFGARMELIADRIDELMFVHFKSGDDIQEFLFANGANINAISDQGETLLTLYINNGYSESIERLISKGAIPDLANGKGKTPLDIAYERNASYIISMLEEAIAPERLKEIKADGRLDKIRESNNCKMSDGKYSCEARLRNILKLSQSCHYETSKDMVEQMKYCFYHCKDKNRDKRLEIDLENDIDREICNHSYISTTLKVIRNHLTLGRDQYEMLDFLLDIQNYIVDKISPKYSIDRFQNMMFEIVKLISLSLDAESNHKFTEHRDLPFANSDYNRETLLKDLEIHNHTKIKKPVGKLYRFFVVELFLGMYYSEFYLKDDLYIYYQGRKIKAADRDSFIPLRANFAKDKSNVYYKGMVVKDADVESFALHPDYNDSYDYKRIGFDKYRAYKDRKVCNQSDLSKYEFEKLKLYLDYYPRWKENYSFIADLVKEN